MNENLFNKLYGFDDYFLKLSLLLKKDQFPKCLLLSGKKGCGKFTFIQHLLANFFDTKNYDIKKKIISENNILYDLKNSNNENIIYFCGLDNIKIDQIRDLKDQLQKSTLNNKKRFIVLDNIEVFNTNCLNALLKSIEEPNIFNNFILINNKKLPIIETIKSRSIEIKLFLNRNENNFIIENIIKDRNLKKNFDFIDISLTPGDFIVFNQICSENNVNIDEKLIDNMFVLLKLFKQTKDTKYIDFSIFLVSQYYYKLTKLNSLDTNLFEKRSFVIKKIYDFRKLNLNLNNLFLDIKQYI